jgi:hypothetical protein
MDGALERWQCPICGALSGACQEYLWAAGGPLLRRAPMPNFVSDKRLYVNADRSKIVDETDPEATFLLVGEGGTVSDEDAEKYGLKAQPPAANKARTPATEPAAETPPATK